MKLKQILINEAPLADITYHNRYGIRGSFTDAERSLISKLIATKTYHEKLKKLPFELYVYIVDDKSLMKFAKVFPEGEITKDDIIHGSYSDRDEAGQIELNHPRFENVFKLIADNAKKDPSGVHFIIGDNYSPDNQINLTPWMVAHRLCHAIFPGHPFMEKIPTTETDDGPRNIDPKKYFTFKSAQHGASNLELMTELTTQYLVTGDIPVKKSGEIEYDEVVKFARELKEFIADKVNKIKGKIYYI